MEYSYEVEACLSMQGEEVCAHLGLRLYEENRLPEILRCRLGHCVTANASVVHQMRREMSMSNMPYGEVDIKPFTDGKCDARGIMLVITR